MPFKFGGGGCCRLRGCCRRPHRWNTHQIADGKATGRVDALAVNAHLPAPQNTVEMALGNPFQMPCEKVVDTLAFAAFIDRD